MTQNRPDMLSEGEVYTNKISSDVQPSPQSAPTLRDCTANSSFGDYCRVLAGSQYSEYQSCLLEIERSAGLSVCSSDVFRAFMFGLPPDRWSKLATQLLSYRSQAQNYSIENTPYSSPAHFASMFLLRLFNTESPYSGWSRSVLAFYQVEKKLLLSDAWQTLILDLREHLSYVKDECLPYLAYLRYVTQSYPHIHQYLSRSDNQPQKPVNLDQPSPYGTHVKVQASSLPLSSEVRIICHKMEDLYSLENPLSWKIVVTKNGLPIYVLKNLELPTICPLTDLVSSNNTPIPKGLVCGVPTDHTVTYPFRRLFAMHRGSLSVKPWVFMEEDEIDQILINRLINISSAFIIPQQPFRLGYWRRENGAEIYIQNPSFADFEEQIEDALSSR